MRVPTNPQSRGPALKKVSPAFAPSGRVFLAGLLSLLLGLGFTEAANAQVLPLRPDEAYVGMGLSISPRSDENGGNIYRLGPEARLRQDGMQAAGRISWVYSRDHGHQLDLATQLGVKSGLIDLSYQPSVKFGLTGESPLVKISPEDFLLPRIYDTQTTWVFNYLSSAVRSSPSANPNALGEAQRFARSIQRQLQEDSGPRLTLTSLPLPTVPALSLANSDRPAPSAAFPEVRLVLEDELARTPTVAPAR